MIDNTIIFTNSIPKSAKHIKIGELIVNSKGEFSIVKNIKSEEKEGDIFEVFTQNGAVCFFTGNQNIAVYENDSIVYKKAKDLKIEDNLISPMFLISTPEDIVGDLASFVPKTQSNGYCSYYKVSDDVINIVKNDKKIPRILYKTKDLFSLLGSFMAIGWSGSSKGICFKIPAILKSEIEYYVEWVNKFFTADDIVIDHSFKTNSHIVFLNCSLFNRWVEHSFGNKPTSKIVPDFIMNSGKELVEVFLLSWFKYSAMFNKRDNCFVLQANSIELAFQLKLLLSKLGIFSIIEDFQYYNSNLGSQYLIKFKGSQEHILDKNKEVVFGKYFTDTISNINIKKDKYLDVFIDIDDDGISSQYVSRG